VSFPTAAAIERLSGLSQLKQLGDAADLATAIEQKPRGVPAAFVVHQRQGDKPIGVSNKVLLQNIRVSVQVVLFVRNAGRADSGAMARREMDALQEAVDGRLMGWSPDGFGKFGPLHFVAARDEFYATGWLCSQVIYETQYRAEVRQ
jgi:hypothetical protein